MNFLEEWGRLITPADGFEAKDVWQVLTIALLLLLLNRFFAKKVKQVHFEHYSPPLWLRRNISFITLWAISGFVFLAGFLMADLELAVFRFFFLLASCWMVIGLFSSLLRSPFWVEPVACFGYLASSIFGLSLLEDSIGILEQMEFSIGNIKITAWGIIAGITAFALTLWISLAVSRILENQIEKIPRLSPSLRVLISKIVRILFIAIACAITVSSMGVDLSALTVFGGAIGLGLGFGLQKVISNFVSGVILLLDNSIKPGDVIEIDGTYGWINNLKARYASVITRDGTEHLIPNEDLITQKVINWSFTDNLVRIKVPIGVSYNSDPHQCIALALESVATMDRILKSPGPTCLMRGFGESSLDLELRLWIADPSNGLANIQSQVLLAVWDSFKKNNIEIPFPQRDLHIRSSEIIPVSRDRPDPD